MRTLHNTNEGVFRRMSNIEERVKKLICEQLGVKEEEVQRCILCRGFRRRFAGTVELVMALEEEFETEIPDEEAEKITTVKEAIDYILAIISLDGLTGRVLLRWYRNITEIEKKKRAPLFCLSCDHRR